MAFSTGKILLTFTAAFVLAACNPIGLQDINATPIIIDLPTLEPVEVTGEVPAGSETGLVIDIIDGDTIDVEIDGVAYRVRYIGVNTPERDEVCYQEASDANAALVAGVVVSLVRDVSETDRFDRLLRYVYVGDIFVNAELVRNGWAEAAYYPPDITNAPYFSDLQDAARVQGLGCWPTGIFD